MRKVYAVLRAFPGSSPELLFPGYRTLREAAAFVRFWEEQHATFPLLFGKEVTFEVKEVSMPSSLRVPRLGSRWLYRDGEGFEQKSAVHIVRGFHIDEHGYIFVKVDENPENDIGLTQFVRQSIPCQEP